MIIFGSTATINHRSNFTPEIIVAGMMIVCRKTCLADVLKTPKPIRRLNLLHPCIVTSTSTPKTTDQRTEFSTESRETSTKKQSAAAFYDSLALEQSANRYLATSHSLPLALRLQRQFSERVMSYRSMARFLSLQLFVKLPLFQKSMRAHMSASILRKVYEH